MRCRPAGSAPQRPLQSVRDPHAAHQHVRVDAGVCGRHSVHHGEEPQHSGGLCSSEGQSLINPV